MKRFEKEGRNGEEKEECRKDGEEDGRRKDTEKQEAGSERSIMIKAKEGGNGK